MAQVTVASSRSQLAGSDEDSEKLRTLAGNTERNERTPAAEVEPWGKENASVHSESRMQTLDRSL